MTRYLVRVALPRHDFENRDQGWDEPEDEILQFRERRIGGGEWESFYLNALITLDLVMFSIHHQNPEISNYRYAFREFLASDIVQLAIDYPEPFIWLEPASGRSEGSGPVLLC